MLVANIDSIYVCFWISFRFLSIFVCKHSNFFLSSYLSISIIDLIRFLIAVSCLISSFSYFFMCSVYFFLFCNTCTTPPPFISSSHLQSQLDTSTFCSYFYFNRKPLNKQTYNYASARLNLQRFAFWRWLLCLRQIFCKLYLIWATFIYALLLLN